MKFIFKCILCFVGVFWLTISILKVSSEVDKYIVNKKVDEKKIEVSKNISSKGDKFVTTSMESIKKIDTDINSLSDMLKDDKISDTERVKAKDVINNITDSSQTLKNISDKKTFSNLDDFRAKVVELTNLVDEYCIVLNLHVEKGEALDSFILNEKKTLINDITLELTKTVKTYEVS